MSVYNFSEDPETLMIVAGGVQLVSNNTDKFISAGETVVLNCYYRDTGTTIYWTRDNQTITAEGNGQIGVVYSGRVLIIKNVNVMAQGKYRCYVQTPAGPIYSKHFDLITAGEYY